MLWTNDARTLSTDVLGKAVDMMARWAALSSLDSRRGRSSRAAALSGGCAVPTEHKLDMLARLLRRPHVVAKHTLPVSRAFHTSPVLRAIDMAKVDTTERLAQLRKLMKERNVDVYSM
jgi:hypothetical protein